MDRFIRVVLAIIAISLSSPVSAIPKQSFISEKNLDTNELNRVKTIALLEVPDPPYYFFGEGIGAATFLFGIVGFIGEVSQSGKNSKEYGEFSFGKTSQAFLKQFLEENSYKVIEYPVTRKNEFGLVDDYTSLNIENVDAFLDVAPVEVGYKQNEANAFNNSRTGPHVSVVIRLVSARTNEIIYAGSVQYGWNMNPLASGIKIDSPEDHKYETKEELKAQKEQAIKRLVRGIEAVSFNIARQITYGEFVSAMSPTMEDVTNVGGNQESIEFISMAATEVAMKTYDEKLWRQSGELASGDVQKQAEFYIKLRSKQLAEKERREKFKEQARINAELAKQEGRDPIEIMGVYDSVLKSNKGRKYKSVVFLARSGNEVKGKFIPDNGDRISGTLQYEKIRFHWTRAGSGYDRVGSLKIKDAGITRLEGTWENEGNTTGTWKLSKTGSGSAKDIEGLAFSSTKSPIVIYDVSGTYVSKLNGTSSSEFRRKHKRAKVTITQIGNKIKGTFGTEGEIEGTLENDTITFDWYYSFMEGTGKWKVGDNGKGLTGTWRRKQSGHKGKWNLTKSDSTLITKLDTPGSESSLTSLSSDIFDLSGTYISDITTNNNWRFKKAEDRRLKITISQNGNEITGTNKSKNLKISGILEGDEISFFTWPSDISSDQINGKWKINSDGNRLTGKWSHPNGGGKWDLTKVE